MTRGLAGQYPLCSQITTETLIVPKTGKGAFINLWLLGRTV